MKVKFNDQIVIINDISYAKDVVDCFIESAYYENSEIDLTDEELNKLTDEYPDVIYEMWYEYKIGEAEHYYDLARGH